MLVKSRNVGAVALVIGSILGLGAPEAQDRSLLEVVQAVEERLGARVGVYVYDEASGEDWGYHADDRFPLNSSFKTLACAALLARVEAGGAQLDRIVRFDESDLVTYSPVTERLTGAGGMTLGAACDATMTVSDNTAANLVLEAIGGPAGMTAFVRSIGDDVTRLDRWETELNEGRPGDPRDTTTPRAIVTTLRKLVLGSVLTPESRGRLTEWMLGNKVGEDLFRAGVPHDWKVGDRSGAGGYGSRSVTAVLWPPGRAPVVAAAYVTETEASFAARNRAIAQIGVAIAEAVTENELN